MFSAGAKFAYQEVIQQNGKRTEQVSFDPTTGVAQTVDLYAVSATQPSTVEVADGGDYFKTITTYDSSGAVTGSATFDSNTGIQTGFTGTGDGISSDRIANYVDRAGQSASSAAAGATSTGTSGVTADNHTIRVQNLVAAMASFGAGTSASSEIPIAAQHDPHLLLAASSR